jgi:predicted HAD superfamily Cof-like phosphohydrolase
MALTLTNDEEVQLREQLDKYSKEDGGFINPVMVQEIANKILDFVDSKSTINKVKEFHQLTQPETLTEEVTELTLLRAKLRIGLLLEEVFELAEHTSLPRQLVEDMTLKFLRSYNPARNYNHKEVLDAFTDIQYVLDGAILEAGMQNIFKEAFDITHQSNMTKFCTSLEEVKATIDANKKRYNGLYYTKVGDKFIVKDASNKTIKSINYKPVDFTQLFKNQEESKLEL